jgi:hypothetical protein
MGNNTMCSLWKDNQRSSCLDKHVTSNFCAEEQAKQETSVKKAAGSRQQTELFQWTKHGAISPKTELFIDYSISEAASDSILG